MAQAQTLPSGPRLKDIKSPVFIGAHIREVVDGSSQAETVALREFNSGQSLWYAAWGGWNGVGQYGFDALNKGINWLTANGKSSTVHMLVGQNKYAPDWFIKENWTDQQMNDMLKNMIYSIMDSNNNKNKVDVWNVANEIINDGDGTYRNIKWNQLGWEDDRSGLTGSDKINARHPIFVRKAFQYARDKSSRMLELRDYNIELPTTPGWDKKHRAFYQLLKHMINSDIPIDAVGIQAHYNVGPSGPEDKRLRNIIRKFKDLGLSVNLNEMDFSATKSWDPTTHTPWDDTKAQQQRTGYYDTVRQAIEGGVSRLETWGIRDGADPGWLTKEHPLLFDENYNPKPAYYGVQSALQQTQTGAFYIRARGTVGGERIELKVDNKTVASWTLSRDWAGYHYSGYSGTHNVKVAFTNDGVIKDKDRDVQIDYLWVNGNVHQAKTRPNAGASKAGEWMRRNGSINFGSIKGKQVSETLLQNGNAGHTTSTTK
jgi:endo-1,4-beta-xylanase